jgi:hypothetical protein
MARKAATLEYLERLVKWAGGRADFCQLTSIRASNLSSYLAGTKSISWKRLRNATRSVFGEPPAFVPVVEGYDFRLNGVPTLAIVPREPGLYALYDSAMRVIYYGRATSLYAELRQTLNRHVAEVRPWTGAKNLTFRAITAYISAYKIARGDSIFVHDLEAFGLKLLVNNTFNKNGAQFKRVK